MSTPTLLANASLHLKGAWYAKQPPKPQAKTKGRRIVSRTWYPIINEEACVGCSACLDLCQHGVYKASAQTVCPDVVYPRGCVHGCRGCERLCPASAISYNGDDGSAGIDYSFETYKPALSCEGKPKVAFVCIHNSCRSQIAEALGRKLAPDAFDSYSAGTELKSSINPDAQRLMIERYGIDMEGNGQRSKLASEVPAPDVVVFMGCEVRCPNVPSEYAEDWGIDDPTGKGDDAFVRVIDEIEQRILMLKKRLSR